MTEMVCSGATTASGDVSAIAQMVHDMVEETELRVALDTVVESIFARQLSEAFTHEHGPLDYWRQVEGEWRRATGGNPIPTKYRTNKSVILKAFGSCPHVAGWTGDGGEVLGKSAIQNHLSGDGKLTREGALKKIIHIIQRHNIDQGEVESLELCRELAIILGDYT